MVMQRVGSNMATSVGPDGEADVSLAAAAAAGNQGTAGTSASGAFATQRTAAAAACGNGKCDAREHCSSCAQDCRQPDRAPCQRIGIMCSGWCVLLPDFDPLESRRSCECRDSDLPCRHENLHSHMS